MCDDWKLHSAPGNAPGATIYATVAQFRRHLGKHLEQLALFSLPKAGDDSGQDADSNDAIADESLSSVSITDSDDSSGSEEDDDEDIEEVVARVLSQMNLPPDIYAERLVDITEEVTKSVLANRLHSEGEPGSSSAKFKEALIDDIEWDNPERTPVERIWGNLFTDSDSTVIQQPTHRLEQFLRGLANHLVRAIATKL
jgi:hypothetical protein